MVKEFIVNGKKIPEVNFDVGESYAGLIPTSSKNTSSLFFWYFPTSNPQGKNDLTIWLNVFLLLLTTSILLTNLNRVVLAAVHWKDYCKKTGHSYGIMELSNPYETLGLGFA